VPGLKQLRLLWWTLFVGPLLGILSWLVAFFSSNPLTLAAGPFGLAIVVVSISVRVLLLGLLPYQMAVSRKSRHATSAIEAEIGPELSRLRKRFAKDRGALDRATVDLYRKHGINPLGPALVAVRSSLLPLIIQLPIMAAVYTVIRMYAASPLAGHDLHFLWIPSLAATDPFFILPLLVGLTSFLLVRLTARSTPTQMDSVSASRGSMGMVYPMAMAVTAQFVPAALAIYWIAGNIAAMVQQHLVNIRIS
jgi:YidC/Oxa1 family membrane protein insertase